MPTAGVRRLRSAPLPARRVAGARHVADSDRPRNPSSAQNPGLGRAVGIKDTSLPGRDPCLSVAQPDLDQALGIDENLAGCGGCDERTLA